MQTAALAIYTPPEQDRGDLFWDPAALDHAMRLAGTIAASELVPKHFRGKPADVLIALQIAHRTGRDPWTVIQSIYVVGGRPGWAATYLIALANAAGFPVRWRVERRPEPLQFEREVWGEQRGEKRRLKATMPDLTVWAYSPAAPDDQVEVSSRLAIDEGWASNPKYSTLAEQMLRYRAATLLVRLYHPELLLGIPTVDELDDVAAATEPVPRIQMPATAPTSAPAEPPRGMAAVRAALPPPSPEPPPRESAPPGASGGGKTHDPVREAVLAELREVYASNATVVADACRAEGTQPSQLGRLGLERLHAVQARVKAALAAPTAPTEPTAPAPTPITDETQAAIGEWCLSLEDQGKGDAVSAAFNAVGLDAEQGPETEEQGLALLAELKKAGA